MWWRRKKKEVLPDDVSPEIYELGRLLYTSPELFTEESERNYEIFTLEEVNVEMRFRTDRNYLTGLPLINTREREFLIACYTALRVKQREEAIEREMNRNAEHRKYFLARLSHYLPKPSKDLENE